MPFLKLMSVVILSQPDASAAVQNQRVIEIVGGQTATIRTALGLATVIETPEPPIKVILGDPKAYSIEFLEAGVVVTPLGRARHTNLHLITNRDRFLINLSAGTQAFSDYLVKLKRPNQPLLNVTTKWTPFVRTLSDDELTIWLKRLGIAENKVLRIEFEIAASSKAAFDPASIWITQGGKTIPINIFYVSHILLIPRTRAIGAIELLAEDLAPLTPIKFEIRRRAVSSAKIPGFAKWR